MSAKQILVVDDEKNQRDILQLILSGERDEQGDPLYEVKDRELRAGGGAARVQKRKFRPCDRPT